MFWKKKKEIDYKMKEIYETDNLYVASLKYVSSVAIEVEAVMTKVTEQKYIFEAVIENNDIKFREVFTGLIVSTKSEHFDVPYADIAVPFASYFNDNSVRKLTKYSLIWALNEINYPSNTNNKEKAKRSPIT